jgi:hypothetical protein
VLARADAAYLLERRAEGEGSGEADFAGYGVQGGAGFAEKFGGEGDPLFAQICHGGLPDEGGEACGERRAGHAGLGGQLLNCPGADEVVVQQSQGVPGDGVAVGAGLEWTVLRLRWFFQNFSEDFLRDPVLSGEVRLPAGDGREAFVDAEDFAAEQRAQGVPQEWIELFIGLYTSVRSGALSTLTDDVSKVLGRPARDFADYAKTASAQGAWNL